MSALIYSMRTLFILSSLLLQSSPPPVTAPPQAEHSISVNVALVNVLFTVSDRKGRFVTSLPKEKFRVFDNNKAQVITHFTSETDLPLAVALLIDTSGSVTDKVEFEREAAIGFLKSTLRRGKDKALLMTFDSRTELLHDYTDDTSALTRAAEKIRVGGGTAMYDAIYLAASEKLARQTGRRIEILISDGNDTSSRKSLDEALQAVQQSDTTIYCISTNSILKNSSRDADRGNKTLRRLAEETGGRVIIPAKTDELAAAFKKIDEELRSQYTLAYRPSQPGQDGAFHTIRIETNDRDLRIQARNGYFAPRNN
jgi:Ca-activated chloride channel family protein